MRRLQRSHLPLVDGVIGNAFETDTAVRPRLDAGPFDAFIKVARLPGRKMIDMPGRPSGPARGDPPADVTASHPLFRIDHFPILIFVGGAVGDVRMVGDHALPGARLATLKGEPL